MHPHWIPLPKMLSRHQDRTYYPLNQPCTLSSTLTRPSIICRLRLGCMAITQHLALTLQWRRIHTHRLPTTPHFLMDNSRDRFLLGRSKTHQHLRLLPPYSLVFHLQIFAPVTKSPSLTKRNSPYSSISLETMP